MTEILCDGLIRWSGSPTLLSTSAKFRELRWHVGRPSIKGDIGAFTLSKELVDGVSVTIPYQMLPMKAPNVTVRTRTGIEYGIA